MTVRVRSEPEQRQSVEQILAFVPGVPQAKQLHEMLR